MFRELDLYQGIICACAVLVPIAGWGAWSLTARIEMGERAIQAAEHGLLESIGSLQSEVEKVRRDTTRTLEDHGPFFQKWVFQSSATEMSASDFTISPVGELAVRKLNAIDSEVTIAFKRAGKDDYALPRDYVMALLHNIESSLPEVWKLRHLRLRNEDAGRLVALRQVPPPEIADHWLLDGLKFARRAPDTDR